MPEPRDPAPGNEDLSAFGGEGATVLEGVGIDETAGANSQTAGAGAPRRQSNGPAASPAAPAAGTGGPRRQSNRPAASRGASPTGGSGPVDNFMNKVTLGTYKFTFYIVNSEVYNSPREFLGSSDESALSSGKACIISENGVEGAYMMENVVIVGTAANAGQGNTDITQISFDLMEPLGFSLLDRLLTVGRELNRGASDSGNFGNLVYVIKLEFLGRDPVSGATRKYPENFLYKGKIQQITGTTGAAGTNYHIIFAPEELTVLEQTQHTTSITVRGVTDVASFAANLQRSLNEHQRSIMVPAQTRPFIEWKVELGDRMQIAARDFGVARVPEFDLASAPWGGVASSSTSGGQAQQLDANGQERQISFNGHSQLIAEIQSAISSNTPTFAAWQIEAREYGISESITVILNDRDLDEVDPAFNLPRKEMTITINVRTDPSIAPTQSDRATQLRSNTETQTERFDTVIFPWLLKKYTYLYTGENTEVLDIDLNLNQLFFSAQSPAAGIYYANNHNQFEPNIIEPTQQQSDNNNSAAQPQRESRASARYLSDIRLNKFNILQSTIFNEAQRSSQAQQVNETTTADTIAAAAIEEYSRRVADSQIVNISVRGDPIFLGQTGSGNNLWDGSASSVFAALLSYQPDPEDLLVQQRRGPVDMVISGIYIITDVESKFQNGSFTQTIKLMRDNNSTTFLLLQKLIELELN